MIFTLLLDNFLIFKNKLKKIKIKFIFSVKKNKQTSRQYTGNRVRQCDFPAYLNSNGRL